jgi:hypothetical protein
MPAASIARPLRCALLVLFLVSLAFANVRPAAALSAQQAATPAATPSIPAAQSATGSFEQQLADKFAPIAYLKKQEKECDTNGEPYVPAPVEIAFNDPAVTLKEGADGTVIAVAPAATVLAVSNDEEYLDLPGNPRNPKCDYEKHSKELMQGKTPTTYAHIVVDQTRAKLALQYWFYYYFDDFNNTHESDWEMIQVMFNATNAEEALSKDPYQVGFAQHGGGELADWNDTKFARDGDHPIVYPAAGSHATYYGNHIYLGWGENGTGFGCDDSSGPSNVVPLQAVVVPNNLTPDSPFAWLLFQGRWGERQPWEFNGPKSPNLGGKWTDPFGAVENWRDSSIKVPRNPALGTNTADFFCGITEAGSQILIIYGVYPWASIIFAIGVIAIVLFLLFKIRVVIGVSWDIYRPHWVTFLGIGLLAIPIGILFNGFAYLFSNYPPGDWIVKLFNDTDDAHLGVALAVGVLQQIAMLLLISPAVIEAVGEIREGKKPEVIRSYRLGFENFKILLGALVVVFVIVGVFGLLIIGIPIAIWFLVRWYFFAEAVILDGAPTSRAALTESARVVRGRWWLALGATLALNLVGGLPGPIVGVFFLIFRGKSVEFANAVSSIIYAVLIPIVVIGLTVVYLYLDRRIQARHEPIPAPDISAESAPA